MYLHRLHSNPKWQTMAYTTMTFHLRKHEASHLDSSLHWGLLLMESQSMVIPKIDPNWKYRNSSPLSRLSAVQFKLSVYSFILNFPIKTKQNAINKFGLSHFLTCGNTRRTVLTFWISFWSISMFCMVFFSSNGININIDQVVCLSLANRKILTFTGAGYESIY